MSLGKLSPEEPLGSRPEENNEARRMKNRKSDNPDDLFAATREWRKENSTSFQGCQIFLGITYQNGEN
jgi:hypothetical protein